MLVGILIAFAIVFIIVLAFKPNTRTTKITKIDENGNEVIEYHKTKETSAAGCAAKIIVFPILVIIIILIVIIMKYI
jgi:hypothetical protein